MKRAARQGGLFHLLKPAGIEPAGRGVSGELEPRAASPRTTVRMQAHWLARMANSRRLHQQMKRAARQGGLFHLLKTAGNLVNHLIATPRTDGCTPERFPSESSSASSSPSCPTHPPTGHQHRRIHNRGPRMQRSLSRHDWLTLAKQVTPAEGVHTKKISA
jgi:hypothetical protein